MTGLLALVHAYDVLVLAPIIFVVTAVRLRRAAPSTSRPISARRFVFSRNTPTPDRVVLAAYEATRFIPGAAGNTVTCGHWAQSIDLQAHVAWLRRIFGPPGATSAADRQRELKESAIDYVSIDQTMLREWLRGRIPGWLATVGATVCSGPGVRIIEVAKEHGKR